MPFDMTTVFTFMGEIVGIGLPTSGALYFCSKWFVEKWMDHRFGERLQSLRAQQDAALKHIQSSIDHQIHRAKKLYDTEFDVLTKAWNMLEDLYGHVADTTRTAPIFSEWENANHDEIRAVLDKCTSYTEDEKAQVLEADDPADECRVVYDQKRAEVYTNASMEFGHYLGSNGIFMRRDIRDRFKRLATLITLVFGEFASNIRRENRLSVHSRTLQDEGRTLRRELSDLIDQRLWSATETRG